jgi:kynureninase
MLMLKRGKEVFDQLTGSGIFADWREPDVIRIAPVPLYNSFEEVWIFGATLQKILSSQI